MLASLKIGERSSKRGRERWKEGERGRRERAPVLNKMEGKDLYPRLTYDLCTPVMAYT